MSANLPLTWANKINSPLLADFIAKHGAEYCLTAEEINQMRDAINEMAVVQQSVFMGLATPTDTPTGTGARFWFTVVPGTYTNFGGVVVAANSMAIIAVSVAGAFSVSQTAFDVSEKINITDVINTLTSTETEKPLSANQGRVLDLKIAQGIPAWVAKPYLPADEVNHLGIDWVSNAATVAGDVPGTSSKWVDRLASKLSTSNLSVDINGINSPTTRVLNLSGAKSLSDGVRNLENSLYDKKALVQTHISEQDGYLETNGVLNATTGFKIRVFNLTNIKSIRIQLGTHFISTVNNFAFYSATSGFGSSNYIVGMTNTAFLAASKTINVEVPAGAVRLLICERTAEIVNYTVTDTSTIFVEGKIPTLLQLINTINSQLLTSTPIVQTHVSEQNGFMYTNGSLDTASSFKIRVFDLTNITSARVQLGTLAASSANAFGFYSATSGFGTSNYISGTTFATLLAANRDMTVTVPFGALRLLVCEFNANIATYIVTGSISSSVIANFQNRITNIEAAIADNTIVCRGDSITAGTDGAYPTTLQTLLGSNYNVLNLGAGSAWIQDISAKQGGVPFLLLNDLAIPANNTTETTIPPTGVYNKYSPTGVQICAPFNLSASRLEYSPCMIDNEEFVMTLTFANGSPGTVTIRRVTAGDAFTIKAGTPIYPNSLKVYKDVLATVFFMGTNNTQSHTLDLPNYADTIVNYHKDCIKILNDSNYLILGLFNISHRMYNRDLASSSVTDAQLLAQHVAYELKMENEFGLQFINLRKYLSSPKAIKDAVRLGYMTQGTADTNAANDAIWQNKGCAAYSFMVYQSGNDFVHPNAVGYKMIAWYVHNWMKKYLRNI